MKSMRTLLKWNLWVCLLIVTAFTSCKDDNDDGNTEDPNYVFKVADEYKTLAWKDFCYRCHFYKK